MIWGRAMATALTILLAGLPAFSRTSTSSIGVVLQANRTHIGSNELTTGATIFDGDRLETEDQGSLQFRAGKLQMTLLGNSAIVLTQSDAGLSATLQRGSVIFSAAEDVSSMDLRAGDVRVRPKNAASTLAQVTIDNCSVVVTSQHGDLEVTALNEMKLVAQGKAYRVVTDPSCGGKRKAPPAPFHSMFLPMALTAVGALTAVVVYKAVESPSRL